MSAPITRIFGGWIIIFLLTATQLIAQPDRDGDQKIDRYAKSVPEVHTQKVVDLAEYLTQPATTDREKVRSFYTWMIHNIQYDHASLDLDNDRINKSNEDVLRRKKAVCYGFSTLFEELCEKTGITSTVISGYSKGTPTSSEDFTKPDHAWNAVLIEGVWHLLDITWSHNLLESTAGYGKYHPEYYFLTPPRDFIKNHLPILPMWQLLDCPVSIRDFQRSDDALFALLDNRPACYDYRDSIATFLALDLPERMLKEALDQYAYNPTPANRSNLGHAYIDYAGRLLDGAERLQAEMKLDSLVSVQHVILESCRKGAGLTDLYDWQKELIARVSMNQAVAYSRKIEDSLSAEQLLAIYEEMQSLLEESSRIFGELPASNVNDNAQAQCQEYLSYVKSNIERLRS
jgi:hypothetical protein